jgi:hypothetical protein
MEHLCVVNPAAGDVIALMVGAEARITGYVTAWLADPVVKPRWIDLTKTNVTPAGKSEQFAALLTGQTRSAGYGVRNHGCASPAQPRGHGTMPPMPR